MVIRSMTMRHLLFPQLPQELAVHPHPWKGRPRRFFLDNFTCASQIRRNVVMKGFSVGKMCKIFVEKLGKMCYPIVG